MKVKRSFSNARPGLTAKSVRGLQVLAFLRQDGLDVAQSLMEDSLATTAMMAENFDLLIRDMGSWATHLPAEMLQIPEIDMIGISSLLPICETSWSIPNPVSYIPQFTSTWLPNSVSSGHFTACLIFSDDTLLWPGLLKLHHFEACTNHIDVDGHDRHKREAC